MNKLLSTYIGYIKAPTFHRSELMSVQWLRGLAVMMVLVYHVEDLARLVPSLSHFHSFWMDFGYSAPDLFFVISGFIMCYVTFDMRFDPRKWLVSRFIRIYPVYFLFVGLAVFVWMINPAMTMGSGVQTWETVIKSLLIFPQAGLPLVFVGWTVEHEIIFYFLVFCVASLGGGLRALLITIGGLSFIAAGRYLLKDSHPGIMFWDYHFLSLYMIEFFMGALAFRFRHALARLGVLVPIGLSLALFVTGGFVATPGAINEETLTRVLVFGSSFTFLLVAALNWEVRERARKGDAYPPKKRPFLVKVGDASYSLYLVHPFCLSTAGKVINMLGLAGLPAVAAVIAAGCMTVIIGMSFYTLAEKPFLQSMKGVMAGKKAAKT